MTREEYINIRNKNPGILIYTVYKERYKPEKHGQFLDQNTMMGLLQMTGHAGPLQNNLIDEYDRQFKITTVIDKNGNFIKIR
jgi:hypothetical protein